MDDYAIKLPYIHGNCKEKKCTSTKYVFLMVAIQICFQTWERF